MERFVILVEFVPGDPGELRNLANRRRDLHFSEVEVLADTESEAHLIACQMVACRPVQVTRSLPSV